MLVAYLAAAGADGGVGAARVWLAEPRREEAALGLGDHGVGEELLEDHGDCIRHLVHLETLHKLGLLPADPGKQHRFRD